MAKFIMVGCDLHDRNMLLATASDDLGPEGRPQARNWGTSRVSRRAMIRDLLARRDQAGAQKVVFAYEGCGFGFTLYDELTAAGIECHVLATSKMERSAKHRKGKTDLKDALKILDMVRSHVLAGVKMPSIWVPDPATRDDRRLVRRRLGERDKCNATRTEIRWLLKDCGIECPVPGGWTMGYWSWLKQLAATLPHGTGAALSSLMRQLVAHEEEIERLTAEVKELSQTPRYAPVIEAVCRRSGVGLVTAMVFVTELGDMSRFKNRRQVGSYIGLTPSCHESGEHSDHKGHITHQGPSRVRRVLCQAMWSRLRSDEQEKKAYESIVERNPKHKKIAVVARMRVLATQMWHDALEAQQAMRSGCPEAVAAGSARA